MTAEPVLSVRAWAQAIHDAERYGQIRQLVLAYIRPDSGITRDQALDLIVRVVEMDEPPARFGAVVVGTWIP